MWLTKRNQAFCYRLELVLFDFDGTLTAPHAIDFAAIKRAIGCPAQSPILEYIDGLTDASVREEALMVLKEYEMRSGEESEPNTGAEETIAALKARGVRVGIITRNGREPIRRALENFSRLTPHDFAIIISREDPVRPKPSAEGVDLALTRLGIKRETAVLVGDYLFDIAAGNAAGIVTVLLHNPGVTVHPVEWQPDYVVNELTELPSLLEPVLPLAGGKLPNRFLQRFLSEQNFEDPALLIRPGVGEDTAAVAMAGEEVLVLKADPITFVTESLSRYALIINANDVVTAGAIPRWFLSTLLFPAGSTPAEMLKVMVELSAECRRQGITLCGGHTEITGAVRRPVVSGMMIGTVTRAGLVDKRRTRPGDRILLTKRVAVEGTAIMAAEFGDRLQNLGLSRDDLERCRLFRDRLSIVPEARIAMGFEGVSALHDVTEGGLATALTELSQASRHLFRIDVEAIPIYEETCTLCRLLKLHPLGLIGSGSLIILCRANHISPLMAALKAEGIEVACIGEVLAAGEGIEARHGLTAAEWPVFAADEITRL